MIAASPSEFELVEDEEMYVVGSVYQAGNVEGTEEIELTATNVETGETSVVGTQEVTAYPNVYYLGALNVSYVPADAGTYDLELGDRDAGTIEVQSAESDIQVVTASPSTVEVTTGEEMHVIGSVYQAGTIAGTETIELTATNTATGETTVVDTQEMTVAPNVYHLGGLNVSYAPADTGTYDLELGDRNAGTVEVVEPTVAPRSSPSRTHQRVRSRNRTSVRERGRPRHRRDRCGPRSRDGERVGTIARDELRSRVRSKPRRCQQLDGDGVTRRHRRRRSLRRVGCCRRFGRQRRD
ncbi:hypothetical protein D8S78_21745 [Natrialba swarupiae]|nr:hypothetical protein [Natrialba swarupiae]